MAIGPYLRQ